MNILLISVPSEGTYFNLCYRFVELGEVGGYLRAQGHSVKILDGLSQNQIKWRGAIIPLLRDADILIFHHSGDNATQSIIEIEWVARQFPSLLIVTYGTLATFSPQPFLDSSLTGIVTDGDWEVVLSNLISFLQLGGDWQTVPRGVLFHTANGWLQNQGTQRIAAAEWALPALDLLPLDEYRNIYNSEHQQPGRVIAGFQNSFELSLSVSRGCPYKCWFCPSLRIDGSEERRRPVTQVINFLRESIASYGFTHVSFFSACFTLDRPWVTQFCNEILKNGPNIVWRCVTTLADLDDELIELMGQSGCQRIGIGIETFNEDTLRHLKKTTDLTRLPRIIKTCRSFNIIPMCFLLQGLPGEDPAATEIAARQIVEWGGEVRISQLINYNALEYQLPGAPLSKLIRQNRFVRSNEKTN